MAQITINEGLAWLKTLKKRHEELLALRNVNAGVVVERKTYLDFATSVADGRLFPQAADLARSPHRPVVLLEVWAPSRRTCPMFIHMH